MSANPPAGFRSTFAVHVPVYSPRCPVAAARQLPVQPYRPERDIGDTKPVEVERVDALERRVRGREVEMGLEELHDLGAAEVVLADEEFHGGQM